MEDLREAETNTDAVNTFRTEIQAEVRGIFAGCQAVVIRRAGVEMDVIFIG